MLTLAPPSPACERALADSPPVQPITTATLAHVTTTDDAT
jgi:hypothetical protein